MSSQTSASHGTGTDQGAAQPGPPESASPGPPEAGNNRASNEPGSGPQKNATPGVAIKQLCALCNTSSTLRCSKCGAQWYCGRACQKEDWPTHKILCASRKAFETPPGPEWRRAIHFNENRQEVEFVWVLVERKTDSDDGYTVSWESPVLDPYFGARKSPRRGYVRAHDFPVNVMRRDRLLEGDVSIYHREAGLVDGYSKPNQGVVHATKGTAGHPWNGPIVVMKHKRKVSSGDTDPDFVHMDMRDFRDAVDYFIAYPVHTLAYNKRQNQGQWGF